MNEKIVDIKLLPWVENVCQQRLKEAWKGGTAASIAYVEMDANNVSLLHRHQAFTEVYFILAGQGVLNVDGVGLKVGEGVLVEIPPKVRHFLTNTGGTTLKHLVISVPAFNPKDVEVLDG